MNRIWERRIRRARELQRRWPFAREVLRFFRAVTSFQQELYHRAKTRAGGERKQLDTAFLASFLPPFLDLVERHGPPLLSALAQKFRDRSESEWERLLRSYWNRERQRADRLLRFFPKAILQPYTMLRADRWREEVGTLGEAAGACPFCGHAPAVVVVRGGASARAFVCSLCSTEWGARDRFCPNCEEGRPRRISRSPKIPWIWVEGCSLCRRYFKAVDVAREPAAEPVVDEIGSVALDAMARARGYVKFGSDGAWLDAWRKSRP